MFNAQNAQQTQTDEIEKASDSFALEFGRVMTSEPHHTALALIEGLTILVRDPAMRQQLNLFVAGQQPTTPVAQALGAGTGGAPAPTADATRVVEVEDAVQQFVLANGGQVLISSQVRGQIDVVKSLDSVKDANDAKVTAAQTAPADSTKRTDNKAELDKIKTAAAALKSPALSNKVEGKKELDDAIAAAETAIA